VKILAIDPGNEPNSAWCDLEKRNDVGWPARRCRQVSQRGVARRSCCDGSEPTGRLLAVEMIASYGMPVGKRGVRHVPVDRALHRGVGRAAAHRLVYRKDVKVFHCESDARQRREHPAALIDGSGPGRSGRRQERSPGPLYG
jgi:hypothetical protein